MPTKKNESAPAEAAHVSTGCGCHHGGCSCGRQDMGHGHFSSLSGRKVSAVGATVGMVLALLLGIAIGHASSRELPVHVYAPDQFGQQQPFHYWMAQDVRINTAGQQA